MAESEDVNSLKRRGRRRLVGAIALVLAAVIVLPMVFDSDPKGSAPPVSVRIPGEDETGFTPKVTPKIAPAAPEKAKEKAQPKAAEKAVEKAPESVAEKVPEKALEKAPEPPAQKIEIKVTKAEKPAAAAERAKAEAALAGGEQFFVPAGAYLDPAGVIEKLKAARIPYYTEPIATKDGTVTRVRAGPFGSREAADKALKQLKDLGLKPGNVAARS
ncbi:MAG: SPOR domain-containing protein [Burkholderiales bacterium]